LNILSYIIVNLFLFSSWYIFLYRKKELISFVDRIIGTSVLALSQIILSALLLGVPFKKLYAIPLFTLNICASSVILIITALSLKKTDSGNKQVFFTSIANEWKDKITNLFKLMKGDVILCCLFGLLVLMTCWTIMIGYLFPSYTWDALWYHLPIVGYIMQGGAIQEVPNYSFINQWINMFPKNIELFFLWNIIFLHNDVITDLSQLFFALAGVVTIYSIALKVGVKSKYALYSSFLFFFTPIMILQSTTNYVDVAISILFLIAINFLMRDSFETGSDSRREANYFLQRKYYLIFAGLTTGILLGAKSSGPLFVGILSSVIVVQESIKLWSSFKSDSKDTYYQLSKSLKMFFVYFLPPVLLLGAYWYIKNWALNNNPVYPMQISFLGNTIFEGLYKGIVEPAPESINRLSYVTRPLYVWLENVEYYLYDSRLGGLGPIWFILLLPGALLSIVYALINKKYNFLAVSIMLVISFLIYPRNWTPRYVIFIVGLGALSFGFMLGNVGDRRKTITIPAFILAIYTFFTANSPCVTPKQIKTFMQLPANERTLSRHKPFNIDLHARQEYGHWIWISNNIVKGDTLVHTFEPLFLSPLWDRSYVSNVVYIKLDSYKEWLAELRDNNATYVLIRKNSEEDRWIETERNLRYSMGWLMKIEEKFKVVYSDENYKIVKLLEVKE
jgi:hypothetical protein